MGIQCPACKADLSATLKLAVKDKVTVDWKAWPCIKVKANDQETDVLKYESENRVVYEVPGQEPYVAIQPGQRVLCFYKNSRGIEPWDRGWDKASEYPRWKKCAEQLIKDLGGVDAACKCIGDYANYAATQKISWSLEAVRRNAMDWKHGRLGKINV